MPTASDIPFFDDTSVVSVDPYDASAVTYTNVIVTPKYSGDFGSSGSPVTLDVSGQFVMYGSGVANVAGGGTNGIRIAVIETTNKAASVSHALTGNIATVDSNGGGGVFVHSGTATINCTNQLSRVIATGRNTKVYISENGSAYVTSIYCEANAYVETARTVSGPGTLGSADIVCAIATGGGRIRFLTEPSFCLLLALSGGTLEFYEVIPGGTVGVPHPVAYIGGGTLDFTTSDANPIWEQLYLGRDSEFLDSAQGASTILLDLRKQYPF